MKLSISGGRTAGRGKTGGGIGIVGDASKAPLIARATLIDEKHGAGCGGGGGGRNRIKPRPRTELSEPQRIFFQPLNRGRGLMRTGPRERSSLIKRYLQFIGK